MERPLSWSARILRREPRSAQMRTILIFAGRSPDTRDPYSVFSEKAEPSVNFEFFSEIAMRGREFSRDNRNAQACLISSLWYRSTLSALRRWAEKINSYPHVLLTPGKASDHQKQ